MLYVQLLRRAVIEPGRKLTVGDIAECSPGDARALETPIPCHDCPGVYAVSALSVARALEPLYPGALTMLGESQCYVHVASRNALCKPRRVRAALAFILLLVGSALALTWFHADVNMLDAQYALFKLASGKEPASKWLIVIPYTVGVGLGVGGYYALIGGRATVSPLDVKLSDYRRSSEETAGKKP